MGRKKIEIKKIEKKSALEVTFSKRRTGVFKKAAQLCVLSGGEAAVIVFSPAGKPFLFGHPTADAIINRFLYGNVDTDSDINSPPVAQAGQVGVHGDVEVEEESGFWLDAPIEKMGLKELENFKNAIEEQRKKVADQVEEMAMMMVTETENVAADRSSTSTVEFAPPPPAAADDSHARADPQPLQDFHLELDFDFDFDFDWDKFII